MLDMLIELCGLSGVSGNEGEVRGYIEAKVVPFADEIIKDYMGNLLVFKKGKKPAPYKIMLAAHMDEVGVIVTNITDEGYLKFDFVGGVDRRVAIGKPVLIGDNKVRGIIGMKAYHLVSAEEEKKIPQTSEMYIDIGAENKTEAKKLVRIGDVGVFDGDAVRFGNGMIKAKAIDDRIGCAVMIKLIESELPIDCWFAFTAQEEVGTRGAFGAAFKVRPEIALVIEGTTAADLPMVSENKQICSVGGGVVVPFMDRGTMYDRGLYQRLTELAERNGINWQTKRYIAGGTDASAIQRSVGGIRAAGIAVPVRYIHSPSSVAAEADFKAMFKLAKVFLESF